MSHFLLFLFAFSAASLLFWWAPGGLFFLAAFPGTLAHEMAHYLAAYVLRGHPHPIDLVPRGGEEGWTLGSVTFHPRWWNGSFVALAPLSLIPGAYLLWHYSADAAWPRVLLCGYLAGCLMNSSLPSKTDWDIVADYPAGFMVLLLLGVLAWHLR